MRARSNIISFYRICFILFQLVCFNLFSQNRNIDSLEKLLLKHPNDTMGAKILNNICLQLNNNANYREAIIKGNESVALSQKFDFKKCEANALSNMGVSYMYLGSFDTSLLIHNKALTIRRKLNDVLGMSRSYSNIGLIYQNQGKFNEAINYINKSVAICEEHKANDMLVDAYVNLANSYYYLGDRSSTLEYLLRGLRLTETYHLNGEEACLNNIGIVYAEQKDYNNALKYFERTLKINEKSGRKVGIASSLANLSGVYLYLNKLDDALETGKRSIAIDREIGHKSSLANGIGNLAGIYLTKLEYDTALKYAKEAYELNKEMGHKEGITNIETLLAKIYISINNYTEAEKYALNSLKLSKEINLLTGIRDGELALSDIYTAIKKPGMAFEHYKAYIAARDSLNNSDNTREITQKEMNYEFTKEKEKQQLEQEKKEIENALMQKQQRIIIFSVIGGLILVLIFSLFLFKRYKLTQQQNQIINNKNTQIEEQNKEIIDSITYAKRLQDAILPAIASIKETFPNSFVLYKPKAIVAGDFYWAEKIKDLYFIAAADSTGHGVPGAIVSVVCSNALNRSVKEFNLTDTGKILDKTRELVLETFEKSSEDVKDGMDISFLCVNLKTKSVSWSGANNALWYVQGDQLKEIKPDKQPIGKTDSPKPFVSHTIESAPGTSFYLFTDGFADQFGGPDGKKFKYKQFSDVLVKNDHLDPEKQRDLIERTFEEWKGKLEQVDDVCLIRIKL